MLSGLRERFETFAASSRRWSCVVPLAPTCWSAFRLPICRFGHLVRLQGFNERNHAALDGGKLCRVTTLRRFMMGQNKVDFLDNTAHPHTGDTHAQDIGTAAPHAARVRVLLRGVGGADDVRQMQDGALLHRGVPARGLGLASGDRPLAESADGGRDPGALFSRRCAMVRSCCTPRRIHGLPGRVRRRRAH